MLLHPVGRSGDAEPFVDFLADELGRGAHISTLTRAARAAEHLGGVSNGIMRDFAKAGACGRHLHNAERDLMAKARGCSSKWFAHEAWPSNG
eukprot:9138035-Alexandrium_andersonii.AAC.1